LSESSLRERINSPSDIAWAKELIDIFILASWSAQLLKHP